MLLAPRSYEIGTWNVPHSDVTGRSPVGSAGGPPFPNQPNFLLWVPHPYWPILAGGPHIPVAHNCLLLAIVGLAPKAGITKLSRLESTRACAWQSDRSQVVRVFRCDDLQYPSRVLAETPFLAVSPDCGVKFARYESPYCS